MKKDQGESKLFIAVKANSIIHHPLWAQIHSLWDEENNTIPPQLITQGSHHAIALICPRGHSWSKRAPDLLKALGKGRACNSCTKLPYTHPELISYYDEEKSPRPVEEVGPGSGDAWWRCGEDHSYFMKVYNRVKRHPSHCPICLGVSKNIPVDNLAITQYPKLEPFYSPENSTPYSLITAQRALGVKWRFPCGHSYNSTITQVAKHGGTCKYCSWREHLPRENSLPQTHPEIASQWSDNNGFPCDEVFFRSQLSRLWICPDCNHEFSSKVVRRATGENECPVCCGNVIKEGVNDLGTFSPELAAMVDEDRTGKTVGEIGKSHYVYVNCGEGHVYRALVKNLLNDLAPCRECHPRSQREYQLQQFIASIYDGPLETNNRSLIAPREVDVYLPELSLAVEFNGTYWHSDEHLVRSKGVTAEEYHGEKKRRCLEKGVTLLFAWEDDWITRREEVEAALERVVLQHDDPVPLLTRLS